MSELREQIEAGFADLKSANEADKAEMLERIDAVDTKQNETSEWIKDVEEKLAKARFADGSSGPDHLKNSLPERHRNLCEQFQFTGADDPVKRGAMEAWLKLSAQVQLGRADDKARAREEMETIARALGSHYIRATYGETTATTGPEVVPDPLQAEVLKIMEDAGVVRPLVRRIPMTSDTLLLPTKGGAVTAYIISESASITQGEGTFSQSTLTAKKFGAYGLASSEVLADSVVGLSNFFFQDAAEQIALKEDDEALEGDGTNFTGINSATNVNAVTNGTDGADPTYAKIIEQKWAGGKKMSRRNAAWITSPEIAQMIESIEDTYGRPIFVGPIAGNLTRFPGAADGVLQGFPIYTSEQVATNITTGSTGSTSRMFFGNFRDGMIFGDRLGMTFAVSPHVGFQSDNIAMRVVKRTGILVALPALFTKQTGLHTS